MQLICTGIRVVLVLPWYFCVCDCGLEQIVGVNVGGIYQPCMRLPGGSNVSSPLPRPWSVSIPLQVKRESLWPCGLACGTDSKSKKELHSWKDMSASRTLRTISFEVQEMPGVELLHHLQTQAER